MPGWGDVAMNLVSGLGQIGTQIGSAFALKALDLNPAVAFSSAYQTGAPAAQTMYQQYPGQFPQGQVFPSAVPQGWVPDAMFQQGGGSMPYINATQAALLSPGTIGALGGAALGGLSGYLSGPSSLGLPFIDVVGQGVGAITQPFRQTMRGAAAQAYITANPSTGALTWFKPAGRPVLWSGDLAACKRVRKVASRARRRLGGR